MVWSLGIIYTYYDANVELLAWKMAELWQLVQKWTLRGGKAEGEVAEQNIFNWKYNPTQLKLVKGLTIEVPFHE